MKTWSQHRYEVKNHAKKSLVANYLKCVIAFAVFICFGAIGIAFLPFQMPNAISQNATPDEILSQILPTEFTREIIMLIAISIALYLLLTAPLDIGIKRYLLLISRGEKVKLRTIFTPFLSLREVFGACILNVVIVVLYVFWAVVLFAVPSVLTEYSPMLGPLAKLSGSLLSIVALVLFALVCVPYALAPFVLAEYGAFSPFKALRIARKKASGAKREFLIFKLSFTLWYLFAFNFPGALFVRPYIDTATARFYDTINECKK